MTCPSCSAPILFGSKDCGCGWSQGLIERPAIEANYWETLAISWRVYWTAGLFVLSVVFVAAIVLVRLMGQVAANQLLNQWMVQFAAQQSLSAIALFFFVPLITRWPYRGFNVVVATDMGTQSGFTIPQRFQVMLFLMWRWIVAGFVTGFAVAPIGIFVGLFRAGFLAVPIVFLATALGAGPLLIRFLIGHQFPDFRLEIQRGVAKGA